MKDNENVSKFTISLEKDLFDWVEEQVIAINKKDRRAKSSRSAVIAHAVQAMKESEEEKSQRSVGVVFQPTSEAFGPGPSTRTKKTSRKAG
jgi:metal-responsive CopG/Arc/MetJ family transcriptional regulator